MPASLKCDGVLELFRNVPHPEEDEEDDVDCDWCVSSVVGLPPPPLQPPPQDGSGAKNDPCRIRDNKSEDRQTEKKEESTPDADATSKMLL